MRIYVIKQYVGYTSFIFHGNWDVWDESLRDLCDREGKNDGKITMNRTVRTDCKGDRIFWKWTLTLSNKCDLSVFNWHCAFSGFSSDHICYIDCSVQLGLILMVSVQVAFKWWKELECTWKHQQAEVIMTRWIRLSYCYESYSRVPVVGTVLELVSDTTLLLIIIVFYHTVSVMHAGRWL